MKFEEIENFLYNINVRYEKHNTKTFLYLVLGMMTTVTG